MRDHEGVISKNLHDIIFIPSLERSALHTFKVCHRIFLIYDGSSPFLCITWSNNPVCFARPFIWCPLLFNSQLREPSAKHLWQFKSSGHSILSSSIPCFSLRIHVPVNSWTFWNLQTRRSKKKSLLTNFRNKASFKKAPPIDNFENEFLTFWSLLDLQIFLSKR
jgi:hypothetical protein